MPRIQKIFKPKATGWIPSPPDARDASWDRIFSAVAEAAPPVFTRPVPQYIPFQDSINCCVWATLAAHQEYMSKQEGNSPVLSFRYGYANTPGGTGGRGYRESASWLRDYGIPEEQYCSNDWKVGVYNFLNVGSISADGIENANKYRIKGYSWPLTSLASIRSACYRQPIAIAIPGMDRDWDKSKDEIVQFTGDVDAPDWYHSVLLWDWTEQYNGVLNWWNDRYRLLSLNYPVVAAMSLEDLPDNWKQLHMLRIIGDQRDGKQYTEGADKKLRWIFNLTLLDELHSAGVVDKNIVQWKDNLDGYTFGDPWCVIK